MFSEEAKEEFQSFLKQAWEDGYSQGKNGQEYTGNTWHGYYGWCKGKKEFLLVGSP